MTGEHITLSRKEVDRLQVMQSLQRRQLKQEDAARQLGVSVRQVRRLQRRYREAGAAGLVSRHRGKRPGNAAEPGFISAGHADPVAVNWCRSMVHLTTGLRDEDRPVP